MSLTRRQQLDIIIESAIRVNETVNEQAQILEGRIEDAIDAKRPEWLQRVENLKAKQEITTGIERARLEDHWEKRDIRRHYEDVQKNPHSEEEVKEAFVDHAGSISAVELRSKNRPILKKALEDLVDKGIPVSEHQAYTLARDFEVIQLMDKAQTREFFEVLQSALENIPKTKGLGR